MSAVAGPRERDAWWPDALGFALGLALAFGLGWQTNDLLWGLWLSSLVIGYATLVVGVVRAPALVAARASSLVVAKVSLVLFFTVHFGLFHFVHSLFLMGLFPPGGTDGALKGVFEGSLTDVYATVVRTCWPWLVAAAVGERHALLRAWRATPAAGAVAVADNPLRGFDAFWPYRNVIRMHLLLFALLFLALVGADGAIAYVLVYAAYFFPWRMLRPAAAQSGSASSAGSMPRTRRNASP